MRLGNRGFMEVCHDPVYQRLCAAGIQNKKRIDRGGLTSPGLPKNRPRAQTQPVRSIFRTGPGAKKRNRRNRQTNGKGRVAKRKNCSAPSFYAVWCRHGSKKRPDCGKPHGSGALKLALSCFRNAGCGYYSIFLLMPSPKQTDVF